MPEAEALPRNRTTLLRDYWGKMGAVDNAPVNLPIQPFLFGEILPVGSELEMMWSVRPVTNLIQHLLTIVLILQICIRELII